MGRDQSKLPEMAITGIQEEAPREGYRPITLVTSRGDVQCRYYSSEGAHRGIIWVGGIGGGFDAPARQLYPRLAEELAEEGIASLRVQFRQSTVLQEAVVDVLAGLTYLKGKGIDTVALVGHSFGGSVVIQAAARDDAVRTVVTLATQSSGAAPAAGLAPRCSILLIHGSADEALPPFTSQQVYRMAHEPKQLILYEGARHSLNEVADVVYRVVRDWIDQMLGEAAPQVTPSPNPGGRRGYVP